VKMDGVADLGSSDYYALADHVHPSDTYSTGFAPLGNIVLTANVHYFARVQDLPAPGIAGRIAFVKA